MTVDGAKRRATQNSITYGGEWRVAIFHKKLWIYLAGTFSHEKRAKRLFSYNHETQNHAD